MKHRIVRALLRLYPAAWRREYGAELSDTLAARPLTARVVFDVIGSGLYQSARSQEPSTRIGVLMFAAVSLILVWNVVSPPASAHLLMEWIEKPMASETYVLILVACGAWTYIRNQGRIRDSGFAAASVTAWASLPAVLGAILVLGGVVKLTDYGEAQRPFGMVQEAVLRFPQRPFWMLLETVLRLPTSWIWGCVGGLIGRAIVRQRSRA